jgi:hypothetical protein
MRKVHWTEVVVWTLVLAGITGIVGVALLIASQKGAGPDMASGHERLRGRSTNK